MTQKNEKVHLIFIKYLNKNCTKTNLIDLSSSIQLILFLNF